MSYILTRHQQKAIECLSRAGVDEFVPKSHWLLTGVGKPTLDELASLGIVELGKDDFGDDAWRLSTEGRQVFEAQLNPSISRKP